MPQQPGPPWVMAAEPKRAVPPETLQSAAKRKALLLPFAFLRQMAALSPARLVRALTVSAPLPDCAIWLRILHRNVARDSPLRLLPQGPRNRRRCHTTGERR